MAEYLDRVKSLTPEQRAENLAQLKKQVEGWSEDYADMIHKMERAQSKRLRKHVN